MAWVTKGGVAGFVHMETRRVGIVGFGTLGQYLFEQLSQHGGYEVVFVWNRTVDKMQGLVPDHLILSDLTQAASRRPHLIVEVAHPCITGKYGVGFLKIADYMVGSPTGLTDEELLASITAAASHYGLYIPVGALWGGWDIQKMADRGQLKKLKITMKKHPSSFKLTGYLAERLKLIGDEPLTLYEGSVKDLCPLAPNNVNTMACAALAAHNLGFQGVIGCLVADPSLTSHVIEVLVTGPGTVENQFSVATVRNNPAAAGHVTGKATYSSFLSSVLAAQGQGTGVHLC